MPKYQFFIVPSRQSSTFTYLDMNSETFLVEKEQLLNAEFEVDGEPILADSAEDAVKYYRFGFAGVVEEYGKSYPMYVVAQLAIEGYKALFGKDKKN
ncbi:hypothetical protein L3V77_02475 [Vibrio sp. DW001]|uniref:hypothetical protein n=1 Tax=Vibrio sp. DW001 TaxID=2912315 RepID=UPI0023AFB737|nr:hypothetical protein [Vibrio sp. DW001]WED27125.1 hypothetical protein L3V77_02475 [Vibrio sp. DW001]